MNQTPFLLLEARFAFYLESGESVWMGGEAEKAVCQRGFKERLLYQDGDSFGKTFHEDETHEVKLENLWLLDLGTVRVPEIGRNVPMVLVIVWYDREVMAWAKRTYFGVTASNQELVGEIGRSGSGDGMQTLRFRAERMVAKAGYASAPDLNPEDDQGAVIRLVNGSVVLSPVLTLSEAGELVAGAFESVTVDEEDEMDVVDILGDVAARFAASGITCNGLYGVGGTFAPSNEPRLEFMVAGRRLATLTQRGVLCAPEFFESDDPPDLSVAPLRVMRGDQWLFSLGVTGAYAAAFTTPLP